MIDVKIPATILLIAILLFNWVGYQLCSALLQKWATGELSTRLDENRYEESELISIKVAAPQLSYYVSSESFQRIEGYVEIDGKEYDYVKRRFYNDTLEFLCIPNTAVNQIKMAREEFFKLVNDLDSFPQPKKAGHHGHIKLFNGEYFFPVEQCPVLTISIALERVHPCSSQELPSIYLTQPVPPPDLA